MFNHHSTTHDRMPVVSLTSTGQSFTTHDMSEAEEQTLRRLCDIYTTAKKRAYSITQEGRSFTVTLGPSKQERARAAGTGATRGRPPGASPYSSGGPFCAKLRLMMTNEVFHVESGSAADARPFVQHVGRQTGMRFKTKTFGDGFKVTRIE